MAAGTLMTPALSGFPAWSGNLADAVDERNCPVSEEQISEYLRGNHFHLCTDEPETTFSNFACRDTLDFDTRQFWIWSCLDEQKRNWDVIVGKGHSPFAGETIDRIWMHAERNIQQYEPLELVLREYPEHKNSLGKAN